MFKYMLMALLVLSLLPGGYGTPCGASWLSGAEAHAATIQLPRTGQTTCFNSANTATAPCAGTGQDGDTLKGVAWPSTRFVSQGNGTVRDDLTGLVWLSKSDCIGTKIWANWPAAVSTLAGDNSQCGLSDGSAAGTWRLPNRNELLSLADYQQTSATWLNSNGFSGFLGTSTFWTSDTGYSNQKYTVNVGYGPSTLNAITPASTAYYVLPVRDFSATIGAPANADFGSVNSNTTSAGQTITLSNTGLDPLSISSITLTGGDGALFAVNAGDGSGGSCGATPTIAPAGSCTVSVTFSPTSTGAKATTLRIDSNDPATPTKDVALSGTGAIPTFTIGTAVVGGNGTIVCDSPVSQGANSVCTLTPATGYHVATLTDNAVDKLASIVGTSYTIGTVQAYHSVSASFAANSYTVTFNTNGGSAVTSQSVAYNGNATMPTAPTKTGSTFVGWYSNSGLTTQFDFATPITGTTTLYAKWQVITFPVTFTTGSNGSLTGIASQTVASGAATTAVTAVPATGYHFVNWTGSDGSVSSTANPLILTNVTTAQTVRANFADASVPMSLTIFSDNQAYVVSGTQGNSNNGGTDYANTSFYSKGAMMISAYLDDPAVGKTARSMDAVFSFNTATNQTGTAGTYAPAGTGADVIGADIVSAFNGQYGPGKWRITAASLSLASNYYVEGVQPNNADFNKVASGAFTLKALGNDPVISSATTWNTLQAFLPTTTATPVGTFPWNAVQADPSTNNTGTEPAVTYSLALSDAVINKLLSGKLTIYGTAADDKVGYLFNTKNRLAPQITITAAALLPPDPPTGVTATAGNAQAIVSFSAPASDGGGPITGYTVISSPAGGVDSNAGTTGLSHVITGLTNSTAYTFTVIAANAAGSGPASAASNSVTPISLAFNGDISPSTNPGAWTSSADAYVGYNSGNGTVSLNNGSTLAAKAGYLGYASGTTGSVTIDGSGSKWLGSDALYVGYDGTGILSVTNGGEVSDTFGYVGYNAGSNGTVTVDGPGSKWTNANTLYLGRGGTGTLNITNGSEVTVAKLTFVGSQGTINFGSNGGTFTTAALSASASQLLGTGTINTTGIQGDMNLVFDASHGATQSFAVNGVTVNLSLSDTNTLDTIGIGSLGVGYLGSGTMSISQGVTIASNGGILGDRTGSTGTATISGPGSTWNSTNQVTIGNSGSGALTITNGGALVSGGRFIIGVSSGSTGVVTVDGTGSTVSVPTSDSALIVGYSGGSGTLNITNGGYVHADSPAGIGNAYLGEYAGSNGTVNVSGPGSLLKIASQFYLGDKGTGILNITNGGSFNYTGTNGVLVGNAGGGTGRIVVNGTGSGMAGDNLSLNLGYSGGSGAMSIGDGGRVTATGIWLSSSAAALTTDVGTGSSLKVTGSITNNGTIRLVAGAGAASGSYTPVTAGTWAGSGSVQALGGIWDGTAHTVAVSAATAATAGKAATLDLSATQRGIVTDPATGTSLGLGFQAAAGSTPLTFTAGTIAGTDLSSLKNLLASGTSVLGGWTFSADSGYTEGSPVYLSVSVGSGIDRANLTVWRFDGSAWTAYTAADLAYDGTYASFTVANSGAYAVTGTPAAPPATAPSGDLNNDGTTDVADALRALRIAVGLESATVDDYAKGDVAPLKNGKPAPDGVIDIADAVVLLQKAVGLVSW